MGSHLNFKNFGSGPPGEGSCAKPLENSSLVRQSSIYSLTFDEFQSTWGGGLGKDFGSMNIDELLKNIWTAEETQAMTNTVGSVEGSVPGGKLQKQGSLTLPRTLSQKTVDEVWRDLMKDTGSGAKDGTGGVVSNAPQRQHTLGEITLEEFLLRAGVVREDAQQIAQPNNGGFFGYIPRVNNNNTGSTLGFQQPNGNNELMGARIKGNNDNPFASQPLFPKPATVAFASPIGNSAPLVGPEARGSVVSITEQSMNNSLVQGVGMGVVGMGGNVAVATRSPVKHILPDVTAKSNADISSLSPVPHVFSRGRKPSAALEKVIERRQKRMIKNRESAARSRARKQAYTLELEAEIAKLKELNQELQKKQEEVLEIQKNEFLETANRQWGCKRQCLRRTLTGPW